MSLGAQCVFTYGSCLLHDSVGPKQTIQISHTNHGVFKTKVDWDSPNNDQAQELDKQEAPSPKRPYRVGLSSSLVSKVVDIYFFIHIPSSSYITSALAKHAIFAQCHPELKLCSITVNRNCSSRAFCGLVPVLACKASSRANCRDNATNIETEGADDNIRA